MTITVTQKETDICAGLPISAAISSTAGAKYTGLAETNSSLCITTGEVPAQTVAALEECRQWDLNEKIPFQGVSIGMIFCSPPHMDPEQILRQADAAMYLNKLKRKPPADKRTAGNSKGLLSVPVPIRSACRKRYLIIPGVSYPTLSFGKGTRMKSAFLLKFTDFHEIHSCLYL